MAHDWLVVLDDTKREIATRDASEAQQHANAAYAHARRMQDALERAAQAEVALAGEVRPLLESGLSVDDVAHRTGLQRDYVQKLADGERLLS